MTDKIETSPTINSSWINSTTTHPEKLGHYRILGVLGTGVMTNVYRAETDGIGRTVALKVLRTVAGPSSHFHKNFEREAKVMASLKHPNLIELLDFDKGEPNVRPPFMVLEFVEGITLTNLMKKTRLEPDEAACIALDVARALAYAHEQHLIHRDVKPSNILLGVTEKSHALQGSKPDIFVKLVDFGIAQKTKDELTLAVDSQPDEAKEEALGTPAYMAPEQLLGEHVDYRADQFALGIVFYQMITGHRPFDGDDGRPVIHRVRRDAPRTFRSFGVQAPKAFETIVFRCLSKRPTDRFTSTHDLVEELLAAIEARGIPQTDLQQTFRRILARAGLFDERSGPREDGTSNVLSQRRTRLPLRKMPLAPTLVFLSFCSCLLIGGSLVIQWRQGGIRKLRQARIENTTQPSELKSVGFLRVVARPWADVFVNGVFIETTPFARPIRLPAGRYTIDLVHPEKRERRVIEIAPQVLTAIDMTLMVSEPSVDDEFSLGTAQSSAVPSAGLSASAKPSSSQP